MKDEAFHSNQTSFVLTENSIGREKRMHVFTILIATEDQTLMNYFTDTKINKHNRIPTHIFATLAISTLYFIHI